MNKDEYVDLPKQLTKPLFDVMMRYPLLEYGRRRFEEGRFGMIANRISVYVSPGGREPPHFRLEYQGTECRFSLGGQECVPMDEVPREIGMYNNDIKEWYKQYRARLIDYYNNLLPSTAPPQARIRSI